MSKEDKIHVMHILDSIVKIEKYFTNKECYLKDSMIQDAIIRQFEIIGEASKNISEPFKKKYSSIPWKDIVGMRDKLIHGYLGFDRILRASALR